MVNGKKGAGGKKKRFRRPRPRRQNVKKNKRWLKCWIASRLLKAVRLADQLFGGDVGWDLVMCVCGITTRAGKYTTSNPRVSRNSMVLPRVKNVTNRSTAVVVVCRIDVVWMLTDWDSVVWIFLLSILPNSEFLVRYRFIVVLSEIHVKFSCGRFFLRVSTRLIFYS